MKNKKHINILLALILIIVCMVSLVACGTKDDKSTVSKKHREIIEKSIDAVKVEWNRELNECNIDNKEIKIANTIIHELKNDMTLDDFKKEFGDDKGEGYYRTYLMYFSDVDYLVEFVILVDAFGSGIKLELGLYNNCLVGKNGYVVKSHFLDQIMGITYINKFPFIEKTIDYGSAFDRTIDVSK